MKAITFTLVIFLHSFLTHAQLEFTNSSSMLNNSSIRSGVAMGISDMNGDGLDDIIRLDNARNLIIEYQRADGEIFDIYDTGFSFSTQWSLSVADVDENGYNDIYIGGSYNRLRIAMFDSVGMDSVILLPEPNVFAQAANFVDINNDGEIDLFVCNDDDVNVVFENLGDAEFTYNLNLINTTLPEPSDNSGNYGSVWTDYDSDGDLDMYLSKCRINESDTLNGKRVNRLYENDGNNNFSEVGVARKIIPYGQTWSTDFADIDNDGDLDAFVINHDKTSVLYENINNTEFVDITPSSGIEEDLDNWGIGIQVVFDDFDNDGFVDLIVSGVGGYYLFTNNGDKTFTNADPFPSSTPNIQSLAVGDLNNDGFLDIIAGFANGYNTPSTTNDRLFFNEGNDNNFYKILLKGNTSNINGIGARVELYTGGIKQIREVRSGEGYGIMNSLITHFGIGTATSIDSVIVRWPSGVVDVICDPIPNTNQTLVEGCRAECAGISNTITEKICVGESFMFDGEALTESGNYSALYTTSGGCDSTVLLELTAFEVDNGAGILTEEGLVIHANAVNATFQWYRCDTDEIVVNETGSSFTPTESGEFGVIVTQNGCSDTSECFTATISNTLDQIFGFDVEVFPNPVQDQLSIQISSTPQQVKIELINVAGAIQITQVLENTSGFDLDMKAIPAGIYFLNLTIEDKTGSIKLIKQ